MNTSDNITEMSSRNSFPLSQLFLEDFSSRTQRQFNFEENEADRNDFNEIYKLYQKFIDSNSSFISQFLFLTSIEPKEAKGKYIYIANISFSRLPNSNHSKILKGHKGSAKRIKIALSIIEQLRKRITQQYEKSVQKSINTSSAPMDTSPDKNISVPDTNLDTVINVIDSSFNEKTKHMVMNGHQMLDLIEKSVFSNLQHLVKVECNMEEYLDQIIMSNTEFIVDKTISNVSPKSPHFFFI